MRAFRRVPPLMSRSFLKICDIKRTSHTHTVAPKAGIKFLSGSYILSQSACSLRFLNEIPTFSSYFVYTRFLTWSPDGRHLYYQIVFTKKGRKRNRTAEDGVFKEIPSIVPDDETICAILYARNQIRRRNGPPVTLDEIFKDEGYDPYDERVRGLREEGWEYVQDLHAAWERDMALAGVRHLGYKL